MFDVLDYEEEYLLETPTETSDFSQPIMPHETNVAVTSTNNKETVDSSGLTLTVASTIPIRCESKTPAYGGSPKCDSSLSSGCYRNLPPGASPPNCCEVNSVLSETDTLRGCRASCVSIDSSISEEEDEVYMAGAYSGPFPCPHSQCLTILEDYGAFQLHLQQHKWGPHKAIVNESGVASFICGYEGCGKELEDKKLLRKHMLSHREKVFACHYPNCDRKFYERAKLKRHFLVHTGEKPFLCPFENCGKRFGYNANLKTHLRTHTGSRPFACTVPNCKRRFAQASNRNSHVMTHVKAGEDYVDTRVYEGEPVDGKRCRVMRKERGKRERRA